VSAAKEKQPRMNPARRSRTYWVHSRIAAIHNVGTVALLFFKAMKSELGLCAWPTAAWGSNVSARCSTKWVTILPPVLRDGRIGLPI
jgi:hypothetical protein